MLRIVSVVAALVLPGLAAAQTAPPRQGAAATEPQLADGARAGVAGRARGALLATDVPAAPPPPGSAAKTYGPDLAAMLFAPVGMILAPINAGLHAVDETVAPLNAALAPITGPIDPALFAPAPTPAPQTVPAAPAKR